MTTEILKKVESGALKPKEAYERMYPKQSKPNISKKAHFVKIGIYIPESKGVTALLSILLALPLPIALIKPFIKKALKKGVKEIDGLEPKELIEMISTKGIRINVKSNDGVKIKIKTI